jgi:rare lipoprotein A
MQGFLHFLSQRLVLTLLTLIALLSGQPIGAAQSEGLATQTGQATYYADQHQGKKTASGRRFDQNALLAAHRSWPFGTVVRVTNLENKRSVKVRIVDRLGRRARKSIVIDLSRQAAQQLGFIKAGKAKVRLEVLQWGTGS